MSVQFWIIDQESATMVNHCTNIAYRCWHYRSITVYSQKAAGISAHFPSKQILFFWLCIEHSCDFLPFDSSFAIHLPVRFVLLWAQLKLHFNTSTPALYSLRFMFSTSDTVLCSIIILSDNEYIVNLAHKCSDSHIRDTFFPANTGLWLYMLI